MMKSIWRTTFLNAACALISGIFFAGCTDTEIDTNSLSSNMARIRSEFAPDRRVQIFDYRISRDGTRVTGETSHEQAYKSLLELKSDFPELNTDSFFFVNPVGKAFINVSVGNIRSQPKHSAELITQALLGQPLRVWKKEDGWLYIQSPDHYFGWIDGGAITLYTDEEVEAYLASDKVMFIRDFGFSYSGPTTDSDVTSDLVAGNILRSLNASGDFTKVEFPDKRTGFIPTGSLTPLHDILASPIPRWEQMETTARRFMGRPYLWGGTSGKGVDCSGFTKMVYYLHGITLPRDASQQVNSGLEIPTENLDSLRPGDFLFFGHESKDGGPDRVTHVAFHLGEGKIIHASGKVCIESLNPADPDFNSYRRNSLLTARRMISGDTLNPGVFKLNENQIHDVF